MTSEQVTEQVALSILEPFGFRADWSPFAMLAAVIANANRDPKKTKAFSMDDFMPDERKISPKKQSLDEARAAMMALAQNQKGQRTVRDRARVIRRMVQDG